jgi:hypothetical protein
MPRWHGGGDPFCDKRDNLLYGLLHRETSSSRPGAHVQRARTLYERLTPSTSLLAIAAPDCHVRKFTDDGQLLVRRQPPNPTTHASLHASRQGTEKTLGVFGGTRPRAPPLRKPPSARPFTPANFPATL